VSVGHQTQRGARSEVDTRNWRRLVELCEANPAGVEIERNWAGRSGSGRVTFWHVRVRLPNGVQSAMALNIADALECLCDNLAEDYESRATVPEDTPAREGAGS